MDPSTLAICIALGDAEPVRLLTGSVTLSWVHSVEKVEWREDWAVRPDGLVPVLARVKGSGAGMEPPPGSVLEDGWWVYRPQVPAQPRVVLADSGFTGPYTLCAAGTCRSLDRWVDRPRGDDRPVVLSACPARLER